ncbi:MAG: hypothetical protein RBS25_01935 [Bacilli bacterium]|jgi:uncharacterized membrane protein YvbJ|nr:hypothetical protein [Bacilli bacterium]
MKKCKRCGKSHDNQVLICDNCGYDFEEEQLLRQTTTIKKQQSNHSESDLIDYPILSFIMGLLSLIIPIFVFAIIAIKTANREHKPSLEPFSVVGKILGYLGIAESVFVVVFLIFTFL